MKGFFKKKITIIILLLTIISLIFTGIILMKMIKDTEKNEQRVWFFEESIQTGKPVVLKNAYIISNEGNKLNFLYDYKTYEVEGCMTQQHTGIADIHIDGEKISKVSIKPDYVEGVLQSYTDGEVVLKEHGIEQKNTSLPIYQFVDGQVKQKEWTQMILGVSNIQCVKENGVVCGIILQEDVVPTDIRVLMKNGNDIFHPQLYIKKQSDGTIVNINQYMGEAGILSYTLEDAKGLVVCDSKGNALEEVFEGKLHFHMEPSGIVMVNELPMETYLKYVLPSEMPKNFGEEALKAQAVCARTYAYVHMNNQTYAKYGANIAFTYNSNEEMAKNQALELEKEFGIKARAYPLNILEPETYKELFLEIDKDFDRIDFFVSNAIISGRAVAGGYTKFMKLKPRGINNIFTATVNAFVVGSQEAAKRMEKVGGGSIVSLSSTGNLVYIEHYSGHGTAKAAVEAPVEEVEEAPAEEVAEAPAAEEAPAEVPAAPAPAEDIAAAPMPAPVEPAPEPGAAESVPEPVTQDDATQPTEPAQVQPPVTQPDHAPATDAATPTL